MSAIVYISGPKDTAPDGDCEFVNCTQNGVPFGKQVAPQQPPLTQRIRHDYAYLADRPVDIFNSDQPVTRCDRCLKVAMTTIVVTVTVLLYALSYLQKVGAQ